MVNTHFVKETGLLLLNRQRSVVVNLKRLRRRLRRVFPLCVEESGDGLFGLKQLPEVVVTLVSDQRIAAIHLQFMDIPGATDVITFEHGEIIVSTETARRCAKERGHSTEEEIALYIIHGLLHLNGHLDATPVERQVMHDVQNRVWLKTRHRGHYSFRQAATLT